MYPEPKIITGLPQGLEENKQYTVTFTRSGAMKITGFDDGKSCGLEKNALGQWGVFEIVTITNGDGLTPIDISVRSSDAASNYDPAISYPPQSIVKSKMVYIKMGDKVDVCINGETAKVIVHKGNMETIAELALVFGLCSNVRQ